jgi:hypothetical protein
LANNALRGLWTRHESFFGNLLLTSQSPSVRTFIETSQGCLDLLRQLCLSFQSGQCDFPAQLLLKSVKLVVSIGDYNFRPVRVGIQYLSESFLRNPSNLICLLRFLLGCAVGIPRRYVRWPLIGLFDFADPLSALENFSAVSHLTISKHVVAVLARIYSPECVAAASSKTIFMFVPFTLT